MSPKTAHTKRKASDPSQKTAPNKSLAQVTKKAKAILNIGESSAQSTTKAGATHRSNPAEGYRLPSNTSFGTAPEHANATSEDSHASHNSTDLAEGYLLDSGASKHITGRLDHFISYTPLSSPQQVQGVGGTILTPAGVGTIRIPTAGRNIRLGGVYYIPGLGMNLISVGCLEEAGMRCGFGGEGEGEVGIWFDTGRHRYRSTRRHRLYFLDLRDEIPTSDEERSKSDEDGSYISYHESNASNF